MKKKSIVENDKAKIEQVIAELDEKKNEALKKAFERVNVVSIKVGDQLRKIPFLNVKRWYFHFIAKSFSNN